MLYDETTAFGTKLKAYDHAIVQPLAKRSNSLANIHDETRDLFSHMVDEFAKLKKVSATLKSKINRLGRLRAAEQRKS